MDKNRFPIAWIGTFFIFLAMGLIWHLVLFRNFYYGDVVTTVSRNRNLLFCLAAAELGRSFVIAYLFPQIASEEGILKNGLKMGAVAAALGLFGWALMAYAVFALPTAKWLVLEGLCTVLQGFVRGLGIAGLYGFPVLHEGTRQVGSSPVR